MIDIYFRRWLDGRDKRIITTAVILAAIAGLLSFIINFKTAIILDAVTVGRIIGGLAVLAFLWIRSPNAGLYISSVPNAYKMFFVKASLIVTALALFGFFELSRTLFMEQLTVARALVGSLALSLYWVWR